MKAFSKFDNTAEALAAAASMVDSKIGKDLKKFLKKHCEGETLALADAKLGGLIKEKLGIACVYSSGVMVGGGGMDGTSIVMSIHTPPPGLKAAASASNSLPSVYQASHNQCLNRVCGMST